MMFFGIVGRPQTTIGTAMVLCHRFFVRKSHACHDRFVSIWIYNHKVDSVFYISYLFLIAVPCKNYLFANKFLTRFILQLISTAALFLAAKSEETACPLNNLLRASCEILHNQDFDFLLYRFPVVSILDTFKILCHSFIFIFSGVELAKL